MEFLKKRLGVPLLATGGLVLTGVALRASVKGWSLSPPYPQPESIREGSARGALVPGRFATRYFVGGGLHGGK